MITSYTFISTESISYCWTEYYRVGRVAGCCAVWLLSVKKNTPLHRSSRMLHGIDW